LAAAAIDHELVETTAPGQGIELAQQALRQGYTTVVAAGGDGTVNEVINGLIKATPPDQPAGTLGLISIGSGNDFAHTLGIPQEPVAAAQALVRGATRFCDVGHVTIETANGQIERCFNNNFGIGLDPEVTLESFRIQWLSGVALYGLAALRALWKYQPRTLQMKWEDAAGQQGERHTPILLASVGNTPRSGGGFHLTPNARIDDGLLDLVMADMMPRWQVLQLLPKAIPGNHLGDPAVSSHAIRTLHIRGEQPFPLEMDGEVVTQSATAVTIRVQPGRLRLIS
jgi:YegS/Rv2252/BmrU family lipid kinase